MESKQLFIPERINVGFQNRSDTYTKKLAYVIYYDLKGVLRKEKSWQSWRDKKIDPVEFANEPTEGFVLNKGVGGQRCSYGWNARNEYIRVYDPRDFEFEISVANLLFILRECDCSRGKGLEGKFVYAWDGTELVLLPECSTDYQNSQKYTQLQNCGVKAKELIQGASYTTKKQETLTYLGKFDYHSVVVMGGYYRTSKKAEKGVCKRHVFWDGKNFVFLDDLKSIAVLNSDTPISNYAELVDKYYKSVNGTKVVRIFTDRPKKPNKDGREYFFVEEPNGIYIECYASYNWHEKTKVDYVQTQYKVFLKDNILICDTFHNNSYPDYRRNFGYGNTLGRWIEPTDLHLYVELESGSTFSLQGCSLAKEK